MAYVIRKSLPIFGFLFQAHQENEPIHEYLMKNVITNLTLLSAYLYVVLKWGPEYMRNRKAFNLRKVMLAYNAAQVVYNMFLFMFCLYAILQQGHIFSCTRTDTLTKICHRLYFLNKYADLLDTIIFVFRKKQVQISFLHVYHHVAIVGGALIGLHFLDGGLATMIGLLNCLVHTVMYFYYFITIFDPKLSAKYAFLKKRMTQMQLTQFALLSLHFGRVVMGMCECNIYVSFAVFIQNAFITVLFMDFYLRTYGATL